MEIILLKVLPLIIIFFLAFFLKKAGIFKSNDGDILLKLIFYVGGPALTLVSLQKLQLDAQLLYLPLISMLVVLFIFCCAFLFAKAFRLPLKTFGTFIIGSSIINTGFTFPFLFSIYQEKAVVPVALFDLGNGLIVFSFIYYMACRYGGKDSDPSYAVKKLLFSPPLWSLCVGLLLYFLKISLDPMITTFLQTLGNLVVPLTMMALGFYFNLKIKHLKLLSIAIFLRMAGGFTLGVILSSFFGLTGFIQSLVIILCASPVGYNTITFSSLEDLDKEFAASIVSVSILIGLIFLPLLLYFLN